MMATAQQATLTTTMTMVTARRDTTTMTMVTDVNDKDNKGDDASSTGCDEGDNCNRDDGKDACAAGAAGAVAVGSALGWPCAAGVAVGVPLAPATVVVTSGLAGVGKNCAETKFQPSRMATDNNIAAIRLRLSSTLLGLSSSQNVGE